MTAKHFDPDQMQMSDNENGPWEDVPADGVVSKEFARLKSGTVEKNRIEWSMSGSINIRPKSG